MICEIIKEEAQEIKIDRKYEKTNFLKPSKEKMHSVNIKIKCYP